MIWRNQVRFLVSSAPCFVTWATLVTNAGWDRSRNPILRGILKIQNRHRREFCTSSGVRRSFRSVGCARHNLQFHTVLRNLRSFLFIEGFRIVSRPRMGIETQKSHTLSNACTWSASSQVTFMMVCAPHSSKLMKWRALLDSLVILRELGSECAILHLARGRVC